MSERRCWPPRPQLGLAVAQRALHQWGDGVRNRDRAEPAGFCYGERQVLLPCTDLLCSELNRSEYGEYDYNGRDETYGDDSYSGGYSSGGRGGGDQCEVSLAYRQTRLTLTLLTCRWAGGALGRPVVKPATPAGWSAVRTSTILYYSSRSRSRRFRNEVGAQISNCQGRVNTFEKEPCR